MFKRILNSSITSSVFFATFISSFQSLVCALRILRPRAVDSRFNYYIFGVLAGASCLIESPHKRTELAIYVAPKALSSFYALLLIRYREFKQSGRMIHIPFLEVISTCIATSGLMSLYQVENHHISPLLYKAMKHVIGKDEARVKCDGLTHGTTSLIIP